MSLGLKGDKQRGGEKSDKGKGERDWPYGWIECKICFLFDTVYLVYLILHLIGK